MGFPGSMNMTNSKDYVVLSTNQSKNFMCGGQTICNKNTAPSWTFSNTATTITTTTAYSTMAMPQLPVIKQQQSQYQPLPTQQLYLQTPRQPQLQSQLRLQSQRQLQQQLPLQPPTQLQPGTQVQPKPQLEIAVSNSADCDSLAMEEWAKQFVQKALSRDLTNRKVAVETRQTTKTTEINLEGKRSSVAAVAEKLETTKISKEPEFEEVPVQLQPPTQLQPKPQLPIAVPNSANYDSLDMEEWAKQFVQKALSRGLTNRKVAVETPQTTKTTEINLERKRSSVVAVAEKLETTKISEPQLVGGCPVADEASELPSAIGEVKAEKAKKKFKVFKFMKNAIKKHIKK